MRMRPKGVVVQVNHRELNWNEKPFLPSRHLMLCKRLVQLWDEKGEDGHKFALVLLFFTPWLFRKTGTTLYSSYRNKRKTVAPLHEFSRDWCLSHVFASSSRCLVALFVFNCDGQDYFFIFLALKNAAEKLSKKQTRKWFNSLYFFVFPWFSWFLFSFGLLF